MLKNLFKLSIVLVLLIFVSASGVLASGKMEIKMGDAVTLQAEDFSGGSFKWVARKGKEILSTQSTSIFNYVFNQQGEYEIVLTITDSAGGTKSTTVKVLVGERYSSIVAADSAEEGGFTGVPVSVSLDTLPTKTSQRSVHILGDEGRVVFDIGTRDDILEYRIDRNIFVDSDGNGIANDDIDNADHSSYLLGGMWQTRYLASESNKIAAEVTVVAKDGRKAKTQVEIVFEPVPGKEGNVVAVLDTLPALNTEDRTIYVYGELDTVAFYARRSQGDIAEYRIDKNIFVDSDGDGNPANDIDNRNDASFRTGDVWTTAYEKTDNQIIAQLIVVGKDGAGSRIQRAIKFTDRPPLVLSEEVVPTTAIRLVSDKEFVQKGDPVLFSVAGLIQDVKNYVFDWDFNGDGEIDQTIEGDNTAVYIYDSPGVPRVKVRVVDKDGNEADFSLNMLVRDTAVTMADFEYTVEDGKITFTDLSVVSSNLANKTLSYTWSFGDTDPESYEAQKSQIGVQNPMYVYSRSGTYVVTLTVVDADQVVSTKLQEIMIAETTDEETIPTTEETDTKQKKDAGGSIVWTVIKVIFYIVLVVILLVLLIMAGLLVFLKIQHPDLIFEELIDELKIKVLGMMGVHEMVEPVRAEQRGQAMDLKEESGERSEKEPEEESVGEPELAKQDAPVPDWLKTSQPAKITPEKAEVIEGEVEESSGKPVVETPSEKFQTESEQGGGKKNDGSVPDWLKGA